MFCSKCGTQLPDDANFCLKCGKPQKEILQTQEARWETCEIHYDIVKKAGWISDSELKFWARAIGSKGDYTAASSPVFNCPGDTPSNRDDKYGNQTRDALDALIKKLGEDGWEPSGRYAPFFYNLQFRRREKS